MPLPRVAGQIDFETVGSGFVGWEAQEQRDRAGITSGADRVGRIMPDCDHWISNVTVFSIHTHLRRYENRHVH